MKNYIWDFDGMLFDSYPHITAAFLKMMRDYGQDADYNEAKALLEITFASAFEHYGTTEEQREVFRNYEHDYNLLPIAVPFENTFRTLKALSDKGCRHFLYTHRGHTTSQHYLEAYGMLGFFEGFVDSSMGFPAKPAPDAVNYICETYGLDKSETVMIGDREIDVLAGKNAGTFGCLYTKNKNTVSAADYIVDDIIKILEIE